MVYILKGNEKDVSNVIKEQRIRIQRGVISIIPISESGLITIENAQMELESRLKEKDELIFTLTQERDAMKIRIDEMEKAMSANLQPVVVQSLEGSDEHSSELEAADNKLVQEDDSKVLSEVDTKSIVLEDEKSISANDAKKPGRPRNSKKS